MVDGRGLLNLAPQGARGFESHRLRSQNFRICWDSKRKLRYYALCTDIRNRFEDHNLGKSRATKPFRPYKLIYYEAFLKKIDAKSREVYLKSGWGFRTIKRILKETLQI